MLFPTHFMGGALAILMFSSRADPKTTFVATVTGGLAALLTDIDSPTSFIGSRIPIVPSAVRMTVGHRGPLHSLAAAGAICILANWFLPRYIGNTVIPHWITIGYISHLVLDMFTPRGVPLLWPLQGRLSIPLVHTGGILERFVVFPAVSLFFLYLLYENIGGAIF